MEDCPHNFRIIDSSLVISNVQTEDNLVKLAILNSDAFISKRRWQVFQKTWQVCSPHVQLTHRILLSPYLLECLDVLLFKRQNVIFVFRCLNIVEVLADNSNEDVHENEERNELEGDPVENRDVTYLVHAVMHQPVP